MKAIIKLDVPDWQIGQDVTVYFPDTMIKKSVCEIDKEPSTLGVVQTNDSIVFTSTGDAKQGEKRGMILGASMMYENLYRSVVLKHLMSDALRDVFKKTYRMLDKEDIDGNT